MKLLIIGDDRRLAANLKNTLGKHFLVETLDVPIQFDIHAFSNDYDLIILDLLENIRSVDVCLKLRKNKSSIPILILNDNADIESKVRALNSGADDYLTKPYELEELIARIRTLFRRSSNIVSNTIFVGDLTIDLESRTVERMGHNIKLTKKDFNLLEYLARNNGRVITRDMILDHVWESNNESIANVVDVHIKYLRDQIDRPYDKKIIKTVHGLGYKIEA